MLVYCGQTVGWIKMKLGTLVGLGPGHIVLDGDPAPLPQRGPELPNFGSYLLRANGWMDQDATWYGRRPRRNRFCVRQRPRSPSQKGGGAPKFSVHVYCDQTAAWIKMVLGCGMKVTSAQATLC